MGSIYIPHLTLKYSKNLLEKDFFSFFSEAHELIAKILSIKISSCRSLATPYEQYFIGTENVDNAFIHLDILIKSGYSSDVLQSLGKEIFDLLNRHLAESHKLLNIKASVELSEVGSYYFS